MQQRNLRQDKGNKFIDYTVGQQVLVREQRLSSAEDNEIKKLFLLYRGPYLVFEGYRLQHCRTPRGRKT